MPAISLIGTDYVDIPAWWAAERTNDYSGAGPIAEVPAGTQTFAANFQFRYGAASKFTVRAASGAECVGNVTAGNLANIAVLDFGAYNLDFRNQNVNLENLYIRNFVWTSSGDNYSGLTFKNCVVEGFINLNVGTLTFMNGDGTVFVLKGSDPTGQLNRVFDIGGSRAINLQRCTVINLAGGTDPIYGAIHNRSTGTSTVNRTVVYHPTGPSYTTTSVGPDPSGDYNADDSDGLMNGANSINTLSGSDFVDVSNGDYRLLGTSTAAQLAQPAGAFLSDAAPVITTQPTNQFVVEGNAESIATFTVEFSGSPTPTVQWQKDTQGNNTFANITGATSATLQVFGDDVTIAGNNGDQYRAVVTNSGGSVNSSTVTLSVTLAPLTVIDKPATMVRGEQCEFLVTDALTTPTPGNVAIICGSVSLTIDSVTETSTGSGIWRILATFPANGALQYDEEEGHVWQMTLGDQVGGPGSVLLAPPEGWEYVDLVDPDTANTYAALYGYTGDEPITDWQWEKETHTAEGDANYPDGLRVEPEGVAGYMALEAMPLATQTMQHRLIEPDGTLWPLATLTFDIGDDETPNDTPDQSVTGVEPESTVTFTEFTVAGLGDGITVSYTISNGEFAVNSGSGYGSYDGTAKNVQNGYAVTVRHESAAITGGTPGIKTTTLNQNGLLAQFTSTTRAAVAPTITAQPNGPAATSVGAAVTINAAVSNYTSLQWRSNGVAIPGATALPLAFTPAAVGSYSLDFVATSSEGASITSSAHVVTAIALATRIVIPAGVVTGRGVSMAGQTVTVNVWADDGGKAGEFLYSTSVALASSGATNLDSNQNGDAGTTRWYSFPSATGGNSEAFFQTTVQAIP